MSIIMNPGPGHSKTPPAKPLSTGQTWKRFAANTGRAMAHKTDSIIQNPANFKGNALILASFILASSRVLIASCTAVKAQGTPEGPYRSQESIRTDIREVGGFISSFGFLMAIRAGMEAGMRKMWGIPTEKTYSMSHAVADAFKHRRDPGYKAEKPDYGHILSEPNDFQYSREKSAGTIKFYNRLRKMVGKAALAGENAEKTAIRRTYTWAPIAVGSAVSLYVSGKMLEQFTRNHSSDVVDWISSHKGIPNEEEREPQFRGRTARPNPFGNV